MDCETLRKLAETSFAINQADDRTSLLDAVRSGFLSLGFDHFILALRTRQPHQLMLGATLATTPQDFLHEYENQGWSDIDPIAKQTFAAQGPFCWTSSRVGYGDCREQDFVDFIRSRGWHAGLHVPLLKRNDTVSAIAAITLQERVFTEATGYAVAVMANSAMAKAEMLGLCRDLSADEAAALRRLTGTQTEILQWIAEGKSNLDIATIIGGTERTVRYHVGEIIKKLGVATRAQAAACLRNAGQ